MPLFPHDEYDDERGAPGSVLRVGGRMALVAVQLLVLFVLSGFPVSLWHFSDVRPAFVLMAVYYWSIFRPMLLPPLLTFFVGLALDLLYAGPLGMNAVSLLAVQWVVRQRRRFLAGQSFAILWLGFVLVAVCVFAFQWLAFSAFNLGFAPVRPLAASLVLTGLVFPAMLLFFRAFVRRAGPRGMV